MRKLFKHIGMICLALAVAIGSFFVPIRKPNQSQMASADNSVANYSYNGSNILTITNGYNHDIGNAIPKDDPFYLNFDVDFYTLGGQFYCDLSDTQVSTFVNGSISGTSDVYTNSSLDSTIYSTSTSSTFNTIRLFTGSTRFNVDVDFSNPSFNSNIYKIELGSYRQDYHSPSVNYYYDYNFIRYYDTNDYFVQFSFLIYGDSNSESFPLLRFNNRFYYLDTDFTDEELYNQGYNAGMNDNQGQIYNNGYNAGFDDGFSDGKSQGISDANKYSFISLFGALFDAPVAMLMGLLNFEFLGINLWAFVTSLFTLALVLFIIKLIMGR